MDINFKYNSLVESLKLIAISYDEQIEVLPDFVEIVDEIISTFCDSFLQMPQIIENDLLSKKAIAEIIRCFNWIDLLSRQEQMLNKEALKSADSWEKARHFAKKALEEMKEKIVKPDLSHIDWVD